MKTKQNNPTRIYREVSVDDFLRDPILNERRIKAYRDIAKGYNVQGSTVRDIFMLGINFAIANMPTISPTTEDPKELANIILTNAIRSLDKESAKGLVRELCERFELLPSEEEIKKESDKGWVRSHFQAGASFILNHIKGGGNNG